MSEREPLSQPEENDVLNTVDVIIEAQRVLHVAQNGTALDVHRKAGFEVSPLLESLLESGPCNCMQCFRDDFL